MTALICVGQQETIMKLFALTLGTLDSFAYFEPAFIERYEQLGKVVRVEEGAKLVVDTKVIPERR